MTAIVARPPLHPLPMSSAQRQSRRSSARLQQKDATIQDENAISQPQNAPNIAAAKGNARKRKPAYEEEDDGFMFSRVKKKKKEAPKPATVPEEPAASTPKKVATRPVTKSTAVVPTNAQNEEHSEEPEKRRQKKKMSFSTPVPTEKQPMRRSKRLSQEDQSASPKHKTRRKDEAPIEQPLATTTSSPAKSAVPTKNGEKSDRAETDNPGIQAGNSEIHESHSATKIALPFADTPVIRRNKEMRENKSKKGERRSSLSLRGRRASSLIESGNSNALPHSEVEVADFYKHIEAEGLPEPRRMRQLLTWCATRSLDQKPMGATFEVSSAIAAARVIQDELLKDLGNKSELSDWFSREDTVPAPKELPERPNPKNIQNEEKIAELEKQIERLRIERDALEALLKPPKRHSLPKVAHTDDSLLSPEEAAMMQQLQGSRNHDIHARVDTIFDNLQPSVDAFADRVHRVAQYRDAADNVASRVLSIAADKLSERENESRRRAQPERDRSPRRDLGSVLRGLSRADR